MSATLPFPLPLGPGVRVLTVHPTGLIGLEKPAGVLSHPNSPEPARNALLNAAYDEAGEFYHFTDEKGGIRRVWLLNRLDSPTSGVVLVALRDETAREVKMIFSEHLVDKTYHALVRGGRIMPPAGMWHDRLAKKQEAGHVRSTAGKGPEAVTEYTWLKATRQTPVLSLVKLEPKTGRTHQLRIQTATHGHPIIGDKTYGDFPLNKSLTAAGTVRDRMFLHCSATAFHYVIRGVDYNFLAESPLPPEFDAAFTVPVAGTPVGDRLKIRLNRPKGR